MYRIRREFYQVVLFLGCFFAARTYVIVFRQCLFLYRFITSGQLCNVIFRNCLGIIGNFWIWKPNKIPPVVCNFPFVNGQSNYFGYLHYYYTGQGLSIPMYSNKTITGRLINKICKQFCNVQLFIASGYQYLHV